MKNDKKILPKKIFLEHINYTWYNSFDKKVTAVYKDRQKVERGDMFETRR